MKISLLKPICFHFSIKNIADFCPCVDGELLAAGMDKNGPVAEMKNPAAGPSIMIWDRRKQLLRHILGKSHQDRGSLGSGSLLSGFQPVIAYAGN